jgi:chromosome partitioning protein
MVTTRNCSICSAKFEPHFCYQSEERVECGADGGEQVSIIYFCSQRCLAESHAAAQDGSAICETCGQRFAVELAFQVMFVDGRRRYVCDAGCRKALLGKLNRVPLAARLAPANDRDTIPAPPPFHDRPELPPVLDPTRARPPNQTPRESGVVLRSSTILPPPSGPRVLAVFNHKGGTGKTTTAVTLAAGLAARGARVLLVDSDGQGNVAVSLGIAPERTLYHVLVMGLDLRQAIVSARPGLDVLASNETIAAAELYLAGRRQRDRVLAERLAVSRELYDFVIVDCSPSLSLMNQNALVFADAVLCPVACDYLSLVGVRQVLRTVKHVNTLLSHPVRFWGALPTFFDARAKICHEALGALREHFGERCLEPIRLAIKVKEAPAQGKTLLEYASGSNAARDYMKVVERLIGEESFGAALGALGGVG